MSKTAIAVAVRPLPVLIPLIEKDLKAASEAAEQAGLPYYKAAGEKLIEAKGQMKHGEWEPWVKRHFKVTPRHARRYMQLAEAAEADQNGHAGPFSSLRDFIRKETGSTTNDRPAWREPVKQIVKDTTQLNLRRAELERRDERALQRELALKLIDIGYRVLAKVLHPDKKKTGSREAMTRLNAVRDRLKLNA
jgi:hypothetical protein